MEGRYEIPVRGRWYLKGEGADGKRRGKGPDWGRDYHHCPASFGKYRAAIYLRGRKSHRLRNGATLPSNIRSTPNCREEKLASIMNNRASLQKGEARLVGCFM